MQEGINEPDQQTCWVGIIVIIYILDWVNSSDRIHLSKLLSNVLPDRVVSFTPQEVTGHMVASGPKVDITQMEVIPLVAVESWVVEK
jgi:hypothetical protein